MKLLDSYSTGHVSQHYLVDWMSNYPNPLFPVDFDNLIDAIIQKIMPSVNFELEVCRGVFLSKSGINQRWMM